MRTKNVSVTLQKGKKKSLNSTRAVVMRIKDAVTLNTTRNSRKRYALLKRRLVEVVMRISPREVTIPHKKKKVACLPQT